MAGRTCRLGVSWGAESDLYSFPRGNPMNSARTEVFAKVVGALSRGDKAGPESRVTVVAPKRAEEGDLLLFHTSAYVDFVRESSKVGSGSLDYGDTPSFKGVFEASLYPVGSTLYGLGAVLEGKYDHFFNPIGGLHHARPDRAGGFCVFNDAGVAVRDLLERRKLKTVAYVDIDAHHGDGVFYTFESDPRVIIGDIHEDGRFIYPGTGTAHETGTKGAEGTKLNIPLPPNAADPEFIAAFDKVEEFVRGFRPDFILLQCGADGLAGDPITHLAYTAKAHAYAARKLHELAHEVCEGRLLAMGGGGYDPMNVAEAWTAVMRELSQSDVRVPPPESLGPWW